MPTPLVIIFSGFLLKLFVSGNDYSQGARHSLPPPVSRIYLLSLFSGPLTLPSVRLFIPLRLVSCSPLHIYLHFPSDWFEIVICAKIPPSYILINSNLFFTFDSSKFIRCFTFILFFYIICLIKISISFVFEYLEWCINNICLCCG